MSEDLGGMSEAPGPSPDQAGAPDLASAAVRAAGAALLGAGIWIGSAGPIGLTWGLIAVAVFIGWLVGSATRSGAYGPRMRGRPTRTQEGATDRPAATRARSDPRVRGIAVAASLFAWVLGLVGVYLYSLAAIPDLAGLGPGGSDLSERIGSTSFVSFYAQQFGPIDLLEVAALVVAAWWTSR